jgi:hypothetical protein
VQDRFDFVGNRYDCGRTAVELEFEGSTFMLTVWYSIFHLHQTSKFKPPFRENAGWAWVWPRFSREIEVFDCRALFTNFSAGREPGENQGENSSQDVYCFSRFFATQMHWCVNTTLSKQKFSISPYHYARCSTSALRHINAVATLQHAQLTKNAWTLYGQLFRKNAVANFPFQ